MPLWWLLGAELTAWYVLLLLAPEISQGAYGVNLYLKRPASDKEK